jgi:uncharacterized membrane protein
VASVLIVAAVLLGVCVVGAVPGVLLTVAFIRLHDRLWRWAELRWPWMTAEMADTRRQLHEQELR